MLKLTSTRRAILAFAVSAVLGGLAGCHTIHVGAPSRELVVLSSGGFMAALQALAPGYEQRGHTTLRIAGGPSMGSTPNAIPARLGRREPADVVIMVREALDGLAAAGQVDPASITDLATSSIAMVVRQGAPTPDIISVDALRGTLLAAKSVAYSDSASGVHMSTKVFPQLGIVDEMKRKARMIPATPVGEIVAEGAAEVGFQQLSELKAVNGVTIVGLIPQEMQKVTTFSAGIVTYSSRVSEAQRLLRYLAASSSNPLIVESGMEPSAAKASTP